MSNEQPSNIDGMIDAARNYARSNRGGKYHAILWPFSAIDSYNTAEQQFQADRPVQMLYGGQLLKLLNLEFAKLQRLEHTLVSLRGQGTDVREAIKLVSDSYATCLVMAHMHNTAIHHHTPMHWLDMPPNRYYIEISQQALWLPASLHLCTGQPSPQSI